MHPNDTNKTKLIEKDLSYKITGVCYKIHNKLGRFLTEKQYCDALEEKFTRERILFKREPNLKTDNSEYTLQIGRPDFLIENKVVVDIKAKKFITKDDYNQMLKYLYLTNLELGLIINFHSSFLKPKRVLNNKYSGHSGVN